MEKCLPLSADFRAAASWIKHALLAQPQAPVAKLGILALITADFGMKTSLASFEHVAAR